MGGVGIVVVRPRRLHGRPHPVHGLVFTRTGLLVMACIVGAGSRRRDRRLDQGQPGAQPRPRRAGRRCSGCSSSRSASPSRWCTLHRGPHHDLVHPLRLARHRPARTRSGSIWAVLLIVGTTNAVNLTDGLDGLAAGSSIFAFSAFVVIGFWALPPPRGLRRRARARPRRHRGGHARRLSPGSCGGTPPRPGSSWATPGSLAIGAALAAWP